MSGTLGILTNPDIHMAAHVFRPNADGRFDTKALIEQEKGEKTSSVRN